MEMEEINYFSSSYALNKMKKKIPSPTPTCVEQMTTKDCL
jgi:hypothetical protein